MSVDARAEFAFSCTRSMVQQNKELKEYRSYAKSLPMMIKTNGLGAALAFVRGKANAKSSGCFAYAQLEQQMTKWLRSPQCPLGLTNVQKAADLSGEVVKLESPAYRAVTQEIVALLTWIRRFADGMIKQED